jgi:hypothetical protein
MGERAMKITIVGAVLIVAAAIVVLLVIGALANNKDRGPEPGKANGNE